MNQFDSEQVRRIWQRVQSGKELPPADSPPAADFAKLSAAERESSGLYLQLSRHFSGQNSRLLHQLSRQAQSRAVTLRGICRLCDCDYPPAPVVPRKNADPRLLLRRCYTLSRQAAAAYRMQEAHPQFGTVFGKMAARQEECCAILLSLLGSLKTG